MAREEYRIMDMDVLGDGTLRGSIALFVLDYVKGRETEVDGWTVGVYCLQRHEHSRECVASKLAEARPAIEAKRREEAQERAAQAQPVRKIKLTPEQARLS